RKARDPLPPMPVLPPNGRRAECPRSCRAALRSERFACPLGRAERCILAGDPRAMPPASPFALPPPIEPMLAKLATELPTGGGFLYEPKWDGFRAIVFRGGVKVFIQSRDLKPI